MSRSDTLFLDVEASGLQPDSVPTEVAWVTADLSRGGVWLIRPARGWQDAPWSAEAEAMNDLDRKVLLDRGVEVEEVAAALNRDLAGTVPLSDAPAFDGRWLGQLFTAAGGTPLFGRPPGMPGDLMAHLRGVVRGFRLRRYTQDGKVFADVVERDRLRLFEAAGLCQHRALDDAIGHAMTLAVIRAWGMYGEDAAARQGALQPLVERAVALVDQLGKGRS